MNEIPSEDIMGMVQDICRKADQDRLEDTPKAAELREKYCRDALMAKGYSSEAIDEMFAVAMGEILHEDIKRALSGE